MAERTPGQVVLEHALLSQQLSSKVHELRAALDSGRDLSAAVSDLQEFIRTDLESYVRSLVGLLRSDSQLGTLRSRLSWLPTSAVRRHAREHQLLLEAFAAFEQMNPTAVSSDQRVRRGRPSLHYTHTSQAQSRAVRPADMLRQAERVLRLWNTHVAHEDVHFMQAAESSGELDAESRVTLGAHLQAEMVDQHRQLTGMVELAKAASLNSRPEAIHFSRATAALSSHAARVATGLYPAINAVFPESRAVNDGRSASIFAAARAMAKVEAALAGDASADRRLVPELIEQCEKSLAEHAADDERLIVEYARVAALPELSRLLGQMRPGLIHPQTRPHRAAQRNSPLGKAAARLHRQFDTFLDGLDNRGAY